jgi:UTP--glucose-1-phosphate uridylyltransferase
MGERNVIKKAIIPAAGYGTRGLPITKVIPKEMFPIGVKPAVHYIVEEAAASGIEQILMIVSRRKNLIVDYFDHSLELEAFLEKENKRHLIQDFSIPNVQIQYIRQPYAKGLGDAIRLGKSFVGNEPFAVLLPDDIMIGDTPALNQLIEQFLMIKRSIIGLNKVKTEQLKHYGVVKGKRKDKGWYKLEDIIEKPKINPPSNLAVIGRYVFTPTIFDHLDRLSPGVGGEYQLTDAVKNLMLREDVYGKVIKGKRYDIGKEEEYIQLVNLVHNNEKQ